MIPLTDVANIAIHLNRKCKAIAAFFAMEQSIEQRNRSIQMV